MTLPAILLCALLGLAVWHDVRTRRIPNYLVFPGALAGLVLNAVLAPGPFGGLGLPAALAGLALGLLLLLPMYMLRAMGAGDVKLMAMVGAFLGARATVGAVLLTMLMGGLLALAVALWCGRLSTVLSNSYHIVLSSMMRAMAGEAARIDAPAAANGKLPYAIAIAAGTAPFIFFPGAQSWSPF